jgi:hypothetical protein
MKKTFKELTPEDLEYLSHTYYDTEINHIEKMEILSSKFGVTERSIRRWWKEELKLGESFSTLPKQLKDVRDRILPKKTDIILFTSAQNKTSINRNMLINMQAYKAFLETKGYVVELVIAPCRYRNPTSPTENSLKKGEEWWVDEVVPYLYYNKIEFGDVLLSTDSRIRPTAKNPLTSYEVLAKDRHLILPHPKVNFKTMPRFKGKPLRTMSTTGYLTRKNFSFSKAGETAQEHFSYGFNIVEKRKDGSCYIPRNVKVTQDGSFTDLIYEAKDGAVSVIESSKGIVLGDIHASNLNMEVFEKTLDLYKIFKPEQTVVHDLLDGETINPHERKDFFIQRRKIIEGKNMIEDEINHSFDIARVIKDTGSKLNVVISNHEVFLDRHINDMDWKKDLYNSPTYLKYAHIFQTVDLTEYGSLYGYLLKKEFGDEVAYINFNESLDICGYECGSHTDFGVNGAKGSPLTFARLNTKMIGAHGHSPLILDGFSRVGVTCNLDQYYTRKGLSSWAYAHSIIHNNCKNQLLVFTDDLQLSGLI